MEYPYSIEDLAGKSGVTKQSAYAFIKKNKAFVEENSTRWRRQVKYSQAVLDLFLDYYGKADEDTAPEEENDAAETVSESTEDAAADKSTDGDEQKEADKVGESEKEEKPDLAAEIEKLRAENAALKEEIEKVKRDLDKSETERAELIKQNGMALLMLQQEKQEKMLLLPDPNQGWLSKIFGRKQKKDRT